MNIYDQMRLLSRQVFNTGGAVNKTDLTKEQVSDNSLQMLQQGGVIQPTYPSKEDSTRMADSFHRKYQTDKYHFDINKPGDKVVRIDNTNPKRTAPVNMDKLSDFEKRQILYLPNTVDRRVADKGTAGNRPVIIKPVAGMAKGGEISLYTAMRDNYTPKKYSNYTDNTHQSVQERVERLDGSRYGDGGSVDSSFKAWFKHNTPEGKQGWETDDARLNYDYKKYYDDAVTGKNPMDFDEETQHFPDTYKLPSHPTFSNESIYYKGQKEALDYGFENPKKPYTFKHKNGGNVSKNIWDYSTFP